MKKRVAFIGKPGRIPSSHAMSTDELFRECGLNTGNLAFWYAMDSHIDAHKEYFGWDVSPEYLKQNFDIVVFPAANQLNPEWDMSNLAELFEKAALPLLICGLGVQAPDVDSRPEFKAGSKRFMQVISEQAVRIGVRGKYTAETLDRFGVKNIDIIGCPSNFISANPALGVSNERKLKNLQAIDSVALNLDVTQHLSQWIQTCFNWSYGRKTLFVNQAPDVLVKLANKDWQSLQPNQIQSILDTLCPGMSTAAFLKVVSDKFSVFFDTNEWMHQLQSMDISVGTRMHGNMLAWQAGVPAILMPHDSRTTELAKLMGLPHKHISDFSKHMSLEAFIQSTEFNGHKYDTRRAILLSRYTKLLQDTGLELSNDLRNLNNCLEEERESLVA